ncbi:hypothetical protein [Sphingobium fuliginis]|nr:hypothetical protein [Sphingobium fuliginis]
MKAGSSAGLRLFYFPSSETFDFTAVQHIRQRRLFHAADMPAAPIP